ncbi:MAG: thioredoxin family protein [Clostridia bacterium]|nr:thioredoxin family protein [Clostridia bacterium]
MLVENLENKPEKSKLIKIIAPILIIIAIAGIYIIKNNQEKGAIDNADFALEATAIDLEHLKSYGLPIIIDFGADACVPCKEMEPVLKELNEELRGKVIVKFVDVWKNREAAADFPLEVIPTQFFFDKHGNPFVPKDPKAMNMRMYSTRDANKHVYTAHQGGMTKEQIMAVLKEMGVE